MERKTGFEPAISSLARRRFTTKPLPLNRAAPESRPRSSHRCDGAEGQTRTVDTGIFSAVLYHLSYLGALIHYPTAPAPLSSRGKGIANYPFPAPACRCAGASPESPLPAGEGGVREQRPPPPTRYSAPRHHSGAGRNPEPRYIPGVAAGQGASRFRRNDGGGDGGLSALIESGFVDAYNGGADAAGAIGRWTPRRPAKRAVATPGPPPAASPVPQPAGGMQPWLKY